MKQFEYDVEIINQLNQLDMPKCNVCSDSRLIRSGDIFLAFSGEDVDGRNYIQNAIDNGAAYVLWDDADEFLWQGQWSVNNASISKLRQYAGEVTAWFLDYPSEKMSVFGVTGTNGKTSISHWLAQTMDLLSEKCAVIGTVGNGFYQNLENTVFTTPDPVQLQHLLDKYQKLKATAISMEVSSHGLSQHRVSGVAFDGAIFTNLTRDHLDYHGSFEAYGNAKYQLFLMSGLKYAIINIDDDFGQEIVKRLKVDRPQLQVYTYGFSDQADIVISHFQASFEGILVDFHTPWGDTQIQTHLLGRFNAQNLAATLAALCAQGFSLEQVKEVLPRIKPATGRMDCVIQKNKPLVVVDYAHTPDALEKALRTLQEMKPENSQLWCVFGCGGNRDKGKRPLMGAAASEFADKVVVTSDNPRLEDPKQIIEDILPAVASPIYVDENRQSAIEYAIAHASSQDIILIAGKGHETYQDIGGKKHHFSDFEIAQTALENTHYES